MNRSSKKQHSRSAPVGNPPTSSLEVRHVAPGVASIGFKYSDLQVPNREYDADFAWVRARFGAISLFFGKGHLDLPETLRSRIELKIAPDRFVRTFGQGVRDDFLSELLRMLERWPSDHGRGDVDPPTMKVLGDKDHSEWVTAAYVARTGGQGSIDFYSVSPRDMVMAKEGHLNRIAITPVVRVNMTIHEMAQLLSACKVLVSEVKASLPAEELTDDGTFL